MKKKTIITFSIIILSLIILITVFFTYKMLKSKPKSGDIDQNKIEQENLSFNEQVEENISEEEQSKIENIIENQGFDADENIYELGTEYDGREVVVVKSSVQYKVALAGIIKGAKPEFSEIDSLLEQAPTHTGIWIEKNSRNNFLEIINKITDGKYEINDDGFLVQTQTSENNYDKKIGEMLSDKSLYVFDISSTTYLVDEATGNIGEYPFEEMDPHQGYEYFESENKYMFIISENKQKQINQQEALKEILENK